MKVSELISASAGSMPVDYGKLQVLIREDPEQAVAYIEQNDFAIVKELDAMRECTAACGANAAGITAELVRLRDLVKYQEQVIASLQCRIASRAYKYALGINLNVPEPKKDIQFRGGRFDSRKKKGKLTPAERLELKYRTSEDD